MVVLTSHFALFAAFCSVSVTSLLGVAAVPIRQGSLSSNQPARHAPPMLPLPIQEVRKHTASKKTGKGIDTTGKQHNREHNRRAYIVLSDDRSGSLVIPLTRRFYPDQYNQQLLELKRSSTQVRSPAKRDSVNADTDSGVPGTIDIMMGLRKVASLGLEPSNSTSNSSFVLNASNADQPPTFHLMKTDFNTARLMMDVFDMSTNTMNTYCATYDSSPSEPRPMTLEDCDYVTSPPGSEKSQVFQYDPVTMAVRPIWNNNSTNNATSGDSSNDMGSNAAASNNTSISTRDAQVDESGPQNVTLVFTPSVPTYSESMADSADGPDDPSSSLIPSSTQTTSSIISATETETVTITVSSAADASTTSAALPSASASNSDNATMPTSTSATDPTSAGVLNVEIVGPSASSTDPGSTTQYYPSATSSVSTLATSPSANAEQIADSIAESHSSATTSSSSAATTTSVPVETTDA